MAPVVKIHLKIPSEQFFNKLVNSKKKSIIVHKALYMIHTDTRYKLRLASLYRICCHQYITKELCTVQS